MNEEHEDANTWFIKSRNLESVFVGSLKFHGFTGIGLYRQILKLKEALKIAEESLESAINDKKADFVFGYSSQIADLNYRMGYTNDAQSYYKKSIELGRMLKYPILHLQFGLVNAFIHNEKYLDAKNELDKVEYESKEKQIEIQFLCMYSLIYSHLKQTEKSEALLNQAISLSIKENELGIISHTLNFAGRIYQVLGKKADSLIAYKKSIELLEHDKSNFSLCIDAILGLSSLERISHKNRLYVIEHISDFLKESESWWKLSTIISLLRSISNLGAYSSELKNLHTAIKQRKDFKILTKQWGTDFSSTCHKVVS